MKKILNLGPIVRNIESGILLENFLISSVGAILAIRVFLSLAGFPQIATGRLHFAHILWGGFLMATAIAFLLTYLNREIKFISAVIGGIGFGFFIDELGKFITRDNDYFFQPTIALIYVIFVLLFLGLRSLEKRFRPTRREYASNALEAIREVILHDLDEEEKRRALSFLAKCDDKNHVVASLKKLMLEVEPTASEKPGILTRAKKLFENIYSWLTRQSWFAKGVVIFFVIFSIFNFSQAVSNISFSLNLFEWGWVLSSILSVIFVFLGVLRIENKKKAFEMFRTAVLVSIFLTQFFHFYKAQLNALVSLVLNAFILGSLDYLIYQESFHKEKDS